MGIQDHREKEYVGGGFAMSIGSAAFVIPAKAAIQDEWFQGDGVTHA